MPNQFTVKGPRRAVVGHEDRPFDRDIDGTPICRRWDLLICGHALPSRVVVGQVKRNLRLNASGDESADFYENYDERNCKVCES